MNPAQGLPLQPPRGAKSPAQGGTSGVENEEEPGQPSPPQTGMKPWESFAKSVEEESAIQAVPKLTAGPVSGGRRFWH
jgi:hypothetical protein